jgi:hypothetical protein
MIEDDQSLSVPEGFEDVLIEIIDHLSICLKYEGVAKTLDLLDDWKREIKT